MVLGVLTAIGVGLGAVGAIGNIKAGRDQRDIYNREAAIAAENKEQAIKIAGQRASENDERVRRQIGSQRAASASSGVSGGSISDILSDTFKQGVIDSERIRQAGAYQAITYAAQAVNLRRSGSIANTTGILGGLNSLGTGLITAGKLGAFN